jgi:hypothetical protein
MMEDVYLARKRNVNDGIFGFVCFCKVCDVDKFLKALNNVWFGDCKVVVKVASFDRFGNKKPVGGTRVEGGKIIEGEKRKMRDGKFKEGENNKVDVDQVDAKGMGNVVGGKPVLKDVATRKGKEELVVPVLNGEAIPVLQRNIFDTGFEKLVIIPMGANKVFLRSLDDGDVCSLLSEAAGFFNNFFSKPVMWNKNTLIRERGAWVRIYGVPLYAWNIEFFKLYVLDVGCLLRVDDITVDRDRFDYARVLLSTTSLNIIHIGAQVMIDGVLFEFQVIEEWDFSLGEDACLLDEEEIQDDANSGTPDEHVDGIGRGDVDDLLQHLSED